MRGSGSIDGAVGRLYGFGPCLGDGSCILREALSALAEAAPSLVFRSRTSNAAKRASEEAFREVYAKARDLRPVEPLRFAAEHAQAELPAQLTRVFEGIFGGVNGHVILTGSGRTRGDQIALVRGPKGPTAATELNVSAPGVSTAALDEHIGTLVMDLETRPEALAAYRAAA